MSRGAGMAGFFAAVAAACLASARAAAHGHNAMLALSAAVRAAGGRDASSFCPDNEVEEQQSYDHFL